MDDKVTKGCTYCAYCGEEFPTDQSGAIDAVDAHVRECPKHPLQIEKAEHKETLRRYGEKVDLLLSRGDERRALKAERDELLKACKIVQAWLEDNHATDFLEENSDVLSKAIAKAEGK